MYMYASLLFCFLLALSCSPVVLLVFSSSSVLVHFHHLIFFIISYCSSDLFYRYINVAFLIHSSPSPLCFLYLFTPYSGTFLLLFISFPDSSSLSLLLFLCINSFSGALSNILFLCSSYIYLSCFFFSFSTTNFFCSCALLGLLLLQLL